MRKRETPAAAAAASYGSVFSTKFASTSALQLELDQADDDGFIALLSELHQRVVEAKDDNFLIAPATFDAAVVGVDTKRGLDNVATTRGIWLDFDDGDLTHTDFASVFPALRFAAFNTYFSTATNNRWRAFIPTSKNMGADEYAAIVRRINRFLDDQRWDSGPKNGRKHGLDAGKLHAASMFYAPCQAADPTASFFHDYNELPRAALDVDQWMAGAASVAVVPLPRAPSVLAQVDSEAVDQAITAWRSARAGAGHTAFFTLAMRLKRAGVSPSEMEALLKQEAQHARSPRERYGEIPGLVAARGIDPWHAGPFTKQAAYPMVLGRDC